MKFDLNSIVSLISALSPFIPAGVVTVEHVVGALKGSGAVTDEELDADLTALIAEAVEAKAAADSAASGSDPQ